MNLFEHAQQKSTGVDQNASESSFLHIFYIGDLVRAFLLFLNIFDNSEQKSTIIDKNISESSFLHMFYTGDLVRAFLIFWAFLRIINRNLQESSRIFRVFVFTYVLYRELGQSILISLTFFKEFSTEINRNGQKDFRIFVFT